MAFVLAGVALGVAAVLMNWPGLQAKAPPVAVAASTGNRSQLPTASDRPVALDAARYDEQGRLLKPVNLPDWVFLGSSLGMGYSEQDFDTDNPGMFQIVLMEPAALRYFEQHGHFADGSMFALYFYGSAQRVSTNRSGFVLGAEHGVQIHVVDKQRFEDGHAFFDIGNYAQATAAEALPPGNGCVSCHKANAAYDGVFAQFYPRLKPRIPEADLARAMAAGSESPPAVESH
jgi:hypothetical protein